MLKNKIKDFEEVGRLVNEYYKNPQKVLDRVGKIDTKIKVAKAKQLELDITNARDETPEADVKPETESGVTGHGGMKKNKIEQEDLMKAVSEMSSESIGERMKDGIKEGM